MKLRHFSKTDELAKTGVWDMDQSFSITHGMKPVGLWLSDETDPDQGWFKWCKREDFRLGSLRYEFEVVLKPDARVLHLSMPDELDQFSEKFALPARMTPTSLMGYIDWAAVAKQYDGLLITPYCWERRLETHTFWYYGWDVASACIWNGRAVESIKLIRERPEYAEYAEPNLKKMIDDFKKLEITVKVKEDKK